MTGRRTRQTSDAMLTRSEHPIALNHTPARSNPQIVSDAGESRSSRRCKMNVNSRRECLTHGRCLRFHAAVAVVVVVVVVAMMVVTVVVGIVAEGLELEIRLLGHLLREQVPDLGVVMPMPMPIPVVVMMVVVVVRAAASMSVPVVVVRLLVAVVVEGARGVGVAAGRGGGQEEQQDGEEAH